MEIRPSLLSYIFVGSTKWRINYEFPELTLELDGTHAKLNPEQVLETNICKGWMWSTITLKTLDQNYQFKGLLNTQAEKLQTEIYNDAEFLKNQRNADQIKTALLPYLFEYKDFIQQNRYLSHYFTQLFKADIFNEISPLPLKHFSKAYLSNLNSSLNFPSKQIIPLMPRTSVLLKVN